MQTINQEQIRTTMKAAEIQCVSIASGNSKETITATSQEQLGVASLSKPVFTYLVLKLIGKGHLKLDTKLNQATQYDEGTKQEKSILSFAEFCQRNGINFEDSPENRDRANKFTPAMILSHQTGLPIGYDDRPDSAYNNKNVPLKFDFEPGEGYGYSGLHLMYLQQWIEEKTGRKLEDLAKEFVFDPADMSKKTTFNTPNANAANSLYTTAEDYARFCIHWMNDQDPLAQEAFVSKVSLTKDPWAVSENVSSKTLEHLEWGYGWGLEKDDKGQVVSAFHTGDMDEWRSGVKLDLTTKNVTVLFTKSTHGNGHVLQELVFGRSHALDYFFDKYKFARSPQELKVDWREKSSFGVRQEAAIEIMVLNPDPAVHHNNKSVHENIWIKERFGADNYLSIGVMLKKGTSELQYYFFKDCDENPHPKFYSSLKELQQDLPQNKKDIFNRTHKVYLMGHGDDTSKDGFGNYHVHDDFTHDHPADPTEQIYDADFDKLIKELLTTIPAHKGGVGITLEECHADNLVSAEEQGKLHKEYGYPQSFLERLSVKYPDVTFSGTGPWSDSKEKYESLATDARASGGYPELTAPVTSMGGGIWKHGNTIIFHHHGNQIAVRKPPFSTAESAKNLKINTVNYAFEILKQQADITDEERKRILANIRVNRKIIKIEDLKPEHGFHYKAESAVDQTKQFTETEKILSKQDQERYIQRVRKILSKDDYTDRDVIMIALGLNHPSIFKDHDETYQKILKNKKLLELVMVSCGKVLFASKDNNKVINLLLEQGIPINSLDKNGMTALHYAVQNFYVYAEEQLNLIKKLIEHGADPTIEDEQRRTPLMVAAEHSKKQTVIDGAKTVALLQGVTLNRPSPEKKRRDDPNEASEFFQNRQRTISRLVVSSKTSKDSHEEEQPENATTPNTAAPSSSESDSLENPSSTTPKRDQ